MMTNVQKLNIYAKFMLVSKHRSKKCYRPRAACIRTMVLEEDEACVFICGQNSAGYGWHGGKVLESSLHSSRGDKFRNPLSLPLNRHWRLFLWGD
jgi:hypothetical protein